MRATPDVELVTSDGEVLGGTVLPGPGADRVVLAHGFSGARPRTAYDGAGQGAA